MCCNCWMKRQKHRVGRSAVTFQSLSQFSFYGSLRRFGGRLNPQRHVKSVPPKKLSLICRSEAVLGSAAL